MSIAAALQRNLSRTNLIQKRLKVRAEQEQKGTKNRVGIVPNETYTQHYRAMQAGRPPGPRKRAAWRGASTTATSRIASCLPHRK